MPALLEAARPDVLLLELPADVSSWLPWLGHPQTQAPVALAVSVTGRSEETLAFYPFADFSPELAAVRWCVARGVPVHAVDLEIGAQAPEREAEPGARARARRAGDDESDAEDAEDEDGDDAEEAEAPAPLAAVCAALGVDDPAALWDVLVEARAPGSTPEALRRAALLAGWLMRVDSPDLRERDALREARMRAGLDAATAAGFSRPVAVIGSFHAAALDGRHDAGRSVSRGPPTRRASSPPVTGALLPYAFEMFDERSGYPAGIRDPRWRQRIFEALRGTLGETARGRPGRSRRAHGRDAGGRGPVHAAQAPCGRPAGRPRGGPHGARSGGSARAARPEPAGAARRAWRPRWGKASPWAAGACWRARWTR